MIPAQQLQARAVGGFTMMEMTMALLIMVILSGFMAFAFVELSRDQSLEETAAEVEKLARQASRSATVLDREFRIRFEPKRFYALEYAPDEFGVYQETDPSHTWELSQHTKLQIRRWKSKVWADPSGDDWVFSPSGISEPLSVRISDGPAFVEMDFNPLTGTVDERRSYIP
ncbi:MAG: hypothetical protein AAF585_02235 [Verrucomicrobiota bacterium]